MHRPLLLLLKSWTTSVWAKRPTVFRCLRRQHLAASAAASAASAAADSALVITPVHCSNVLIDKTFSQTYVY